MEDISDVYLVVDRRSNEVVSVFFEAQDAQAKASIDLYWDVVEKDIA
jgi:hypothetical protein